MKTVERFEQGEPIPDKANFIKKETVCVSDKPDYDCNCHPLQSCTCRIKEYKTYFYYEVSITNF